MPPTTIDRLAATLAESAPAPSDPKLLSGDGTLQVAGLAMLAGQTHFERLYVYLDADLPQAQIAYEPAALSGAARARAARGVRRRRRVRGSVRERFRRRRSVLKFGRPDSTAATNRARRSCISKAPRAEKTSTARPTIACCEARWADRCAAVPRYDQPLPPLLDLRWHSATPLETAVKRTFRAALAAHAGARVVENQPGLARIAATLDRRARLIDRAPRLERRADVVWCAPEEPARGVPHCARVRRAATGCPPQRSAQLLREAGIAGDAVTITRPGFAVAPNIAPRPIAGALLVQRAATPRASTAPLLTALAGLPVETSSPNARTARRCSASRAPPLVVFADTGDAWGLLGGTALAGGALVVAFAGSPFLETISPEACVIAGDHGRCGGRAARIRAGSDAFLRRADRARRARCRASRSDVQAGRRIRELGRALVHGVVDPHSLAMSDAIAASMAEPASLHG